MTTTYKSNFDTIAKIAGVMLGFSIPISNVLTNICVTVMLLVWCFSGVRQKLQVMFASKTTWAILCLLLIYLIGVTYSSACAADIQFMLKKMSRLLFIPIIMSIFTDAKWRRYALYSFWWAIGASLLFIAIKYFVSSSGLNNLLLKLHLLDSSRWIAAPTTAFKDRIFTSLFFSFAVFSLLHCSRKKNIVCANKPLDNNSKCLLCDPYKLVTLGLAFLCFAYLFVVNSGRSGQVICIGLIILFFIQTNNWRKILLYSILLVPIAASILYMSPNNRARYISTVQETKAYFSHDLGNSVESIKLDQQCAIPLDCQCTGLRLEFLTKSLQLVKAHPWFGYGTGAFRSAYNKQCPLYNSANQQLQINNPHNQYILTLVELGVVGLVVLLGIFLVMLYESTLLPNLEKYLLQGLIFSIMVGCLANSWLMDFASAHYFAYFSGVFLAALPANAVEKLTT